MYLIGQGNVQCLQDVINLGAITQNNDINKIVLIELEILVPIIPPKFAKEMFSLEFSGAWKVLKVDFVLCFQNLKIMPTVRDASR